jgi:predicted RNA-binding Zn ribbon-like protein
MKSMTKSDSATKNHSHEFELTGGALCLDFANTVGDRPVSHEEHLHDYDDLLSWSRQAGALPAEQIAELEREAVRHPRKARAAFRRALELRETLFRIFGGLAAGERPTAKDVRILNVELANALPHLEICEEPDCFDWSWSGPSDALDRPLWPVVRSAADLLTSNEVPVIRECASETCSWLFVDRSRTRRRRWCDMSTCGNRAKAKRHYERKKARAKRKRV